MDPSGDGKQSIYSDSSNLNKNLGTTNYSNRTLRRSKFPSFVQIKWEFHFVHFHLQLILEPMNEFVIFTMATITILNTHVQCTPKYNQINSENKVNMFW